jgi:hypothetical protein
MTPMHRSGWTAPDGRPVARGQSEPDVSAFNERVMAAVARAPRPGVARTFLASLLLLRLRDASAALGAASRLAFGRARPVLPLVRLQSLLLIILLAVVLGTGGVLAAGGTLRFIEEVRQAQDGERRPAGVIRQPGPSAVPEDRLLAGPSPAADGRTRALGDDAAGRGRQGGSTNQERDARQGPTSEPRRGEQADPRGGGGQQDGGRPDGGQRGVSPRDGGQQDGGQREDAPRDGSVQQGGDAGRRSPLPEGRSDSPGAGRG